MNVVDKDQKQIKQKDQLLTPRQPQNLAASQRSASCRKTPRGPCGSFIDCMGLQSSTLSPGRSALPMSKIQQQLADREKELDLERQLQEIYRARLEQVQDYLRSCLETAQQNGFLDVICNNQQLQQPPNSAPFTPQTNPKQLPITPLHSDLNALKEQAKLNGWYIEPDEIELQEQVGEGTTASIYRATWRGFDVAVKCIFPQYFHSNQGSITWFAQELETLSRQRHPFVLRMIGACLDPPKYGWVVTEFLGRRTLKEWLHGCNKRQRERLVPLPPLEERIGKGLEIAQAMHYLHGQKPTLLHRDLKPSNIFLDDAMHVRVADFGHACFLQEGKKALTGDTGTYVYMAPEVIRCEPYNEKCDVYSFAVILNELITGQHPYVDSDYSPSKIALEVAERNLRPTLPKDDGSIEELTDLICQSWDKDASARPSFIIISNTLKKIHSKLINHNETYFYEI